MGDHTPGTCQKCGGATSRRSYPTCGTCNGKPPTNRPPAPSTTTLTSSLTVEGDKAEVSRITPSQVRTLADLIRICEIDQTEWVIERWVANKYEMGSKDVDGQAVATPMFQVKAWLARNRPIVDTKATLAALILDAKKEIGPRRLVKCRESGPHMLEVSIPDLHLGKLAWAPETGHANYDSKIAADLFMAALDALIQRTSTFGFERVVFPVGNDFFHSDTKQGTTTGGTQLDNDSRFHKTFLTGRRLITEAIDRVRAVAPVTVIIVPGNHDALSAFHLGDSLECLYHATPDVEIMNAPVPRKYFSYGQNLLMFTHGHQGKRANYPLLMATERPQLFGACRYREIHCGHTHEFKVSELMGVRVRVSPALTGADAWHSENHFVGNLRGAEALVWSREEGIVATAHYTVLDDPQAA